MCTYTYKKRTCSCVCVCVCVGLTVASIREKIVGPVGSTVTVRLESATRKKLSNVSLLLKLL
jgi:hypothetical protein